MPTRLQLLDDRAIGRALARMASEVVERCGGTSELVLVGIQRRGVELAGRFDVLWPELPHAAATRARPTTMESAKKCLMTGEATQVK